MTDTIDNSQKQIADTCDEIKSLLLDKNAKYGDSALNPCRIMSKASTVEQILVRIDDKLSRIQKGAGLLANDEDVIKDIAGYYILLMIALRNQTTAEVEFIDGPEPELDYPRGFGPEWNGKLENNDGNLKTQTIPFGLPGESPVGIEGPVGEQMQHSIQADATLDPDKLPYFVDN